MAYPSTTISAQPWRTGFGKPYMSPKKILAMPHPNLGVQEVSKAAQMGLSVAPPAGTPMGPLNNRDIIYTPQKQIDLSLQKFYSAKARLLRQMDFTRQLLENSYATTKYANKLNSGRELFQRAMQIRNEVAGLSAPLAMNLARDERQQRAVGASVQAGLRRNDINAVVSQLPTHQGAMPTDDDAYLPSGGMAGGKGQALAESEPLDAPLTERLRDQMEHFEGVSSMPEVGEKAGVLRRQLDDALESAGDGAALDAKVAMGGAGEAAKEYAREGEASGADPGLGQQSELDVLIEQMQVLQAEADEASPSQLQGIRNEYARLGRKYERLTGEAPPTLTGGPPRRTVRRGLEGITEAPAKGRRMLPKGGSAGATTQTLESASGLEA